LQAQDIWALYEYGVDFKNRIDLYDTTAKNERFFAGDQWAGVNAPDLPKPVVNFIKRACQQRIAEVRANPVKVLFSPIEYPTFATSEGCLPVSDDYVSLLCELFETDWERLKLNYVNLDGLQDACISGDYILYSYWDALAQTGQLARGNIKVEAIDNVDYYPGNPNERDVQKQPCIILARREIVSSVRAQAKANGRSNVETEFIEPDGDNLYQSGDMAKNELEGQAGKKCVTLLCLYRDSLTGNIFAQKTTKNAVIRSEWDTRLKRYPVAMMNWEKRKNCCFGRAEITGLVPVQRYINQMYAMSMLFTMQSACPKPLFNQGMIKAWSNAVGTAIPVNGDINAAAKYLEPPSLPSDAYNLPEKLMDKTLEMLGVTAIELGNVNPTNMSAMALARKASTVPIETVRTRFYSMVEDFALIWLDMIAAYQTVPRWATLSGTGKKAIMFDAAALHEKLWSVKIDVGEAGVFSEANTVTTLASLYKDGVINAKQYIERLPDGYCPMRERLLAELNSSASELVTEKTKNQNNIS
jgi:hypothetical protein